MPRPARPGSRRELRRGKEWENPTTRLRWVDMPSRWTASLVLASVTSERGQGPTATVYCLQYDEPRQMVLWLRPPAGRASLSDERDEGRTAHLALAGCYLLVSKRLA